MKGTIIYLQLWRQVHDEMRLQDKDNMVISDVDRSDCDITWVIRFQTTPFNPFVDIELSLCQDLVCDHRH